MIINIFPLPFRLPHLTYTTELQTTRLTNYQTSIVCQMGRTLTLPSTLYKYKILQVVEDRGFVERLVWSECPLFDPTYSPRILPVLRRNLTSSLNQYKLPLALTNAINSLLHKCQCRTEIIGLADLWEACYTAVNKYYSTHELQSAEFLQMCAQCGITTINSSARELVAYISNGIEDIYELLRLLEDSSQHSCSDYDQLCLLDTEIGASYELVDPLTTRLIHTPTTIHGLRSLLDPRHDIYTEELKYWVETFIPNVYNKEAFDALWMQSIGFRFLIDDLLICPISGFVAEFSTVQTVLLNAFSLRIPSIYTGIYSNTTIQNCIDLLITHVTELRDELRHTITITSVIIARSIGEEANIVLVTNTGETIRLYVDLFVHLLASPSLLTSNERFLLEPLG